MLPASTPLASSFLRFNRLPAELVVRLVQMLDGDYSTLAKVQRSSRELYIAATPVMYCELGREYQDILDSLKPLMLIDTSNNHDIELNDDETHKHPIQWSQPARILWMFSKVKRIVYEPTDVRDCWWSNLESRLRDQLKKLQSTLRLQLRDDKVSLLSSVESLAINLAKLPLGRAILDSHLDGTDYETDDSIAEDNMPDDLWQQRHPPIDRMLELVSHCALPLNMCFSLEGYPYHGGSSYFGVNLRGILIRNFDCRFVTMHRINMSGSVMVMPPAKNIILEPHPHYTSMMARTPVYEEVISQGMVITSSDDAPHILVQRPTGDEDTLSLFEGRMDEITTFDINEYKLRKYGHKYDLNKSAGEQSQKAIKLKWGYLGREGRVKGCDLCHGEHLPIFLVLVSLLKFLKTSLRRMSSMRITRKIDSYQHPMTEALSTRICDQVVVYELAGLKRMYMGTCFPLSDH